MKFTQLTSTPTAEDLNNRVAQMFGSKINLESFTVEQLSAARDKLANQLLTIENQANFDAIHSSEAYQKNRLFLKVIEQRIEELSQTDEKAKSPYAIGMAQAMKSTGDTPPLKKSTIKKAHDIAKSVEKNESETEVDETMTRQHFQHVADTLKDIKDPIKRAEYAKHHSAIFQHFNPNFDHAKFMSAAGVEMKEPNEAVAEAAAITPNQIEAFKKWYDTYSKMQSKDVYNYAQGIFKAHMVTGVTNLDGVSKQDPRGKAYDDLAKIFPDMDGDIEAIGYALQKQGVDPLNMKAAEAVAEAKPDFLDMDKDGDKKEPMKKAIQDKKKKNIKEGAEESAKIILAGKNLVDQITGWMEDTAKNETEVMLELGDEIRNEMGSEKSEQYINTVKPALEALYSQLENTRKSLTDGVAVLTGEEAPATMGADAPKDDIEDLETEVEPEVNPDTADDFTASEPATGGEEPADRKKRESIIRRSPRLAEMLSRPFIGKKKV